MIYKKIGEFIEKVDLKNTDNKVTKLLGVSIEKKFIESKANIEGTDLSKYTIVKKGQFAFSPVTSRNGDKFTIALLDEFEEAIVSPAYTVFKINNKNNLINSYLFMWFLRSDFNRYARFNSWGSAREIFSWDELCNVKIPVPPLNIQSRYAEIYLSTKHNFQNYKKGVEELNSICDIYIERLLKSEESQKLDQYIKQVNERNHLKKIDIVKGVNSKGEFIPTKANMKKIDLSNYKIVENNQFAFNPSRLNLGSIALRQGEECIVSPMYITFEIIDENKLLPEYLLTWFRRKAFNHYVWFYAFGSVRDTFDFNMMKNVKLPIPSVNTQKAIIDILKTHEERKYIGTKLESLIELMCPVFFNGISKKDVNISKA